MPYSPTPAGPPRHLILTLALVVAAAFAATFAMPTHLVAEERADAGVDLAPTRAATADFDFSKPVSALDIYRAVGQAFGFRVTFDPKLRDMPVELVLRDASPSQAFDAIGLAAGHFWVFTDKQAIVVADDTPQNRRRYEPISVARFSLDHIDVKDAMTIVRSLVGAKHVAADQDPQTLVIRDTTSTIEVVQALIAELDQPNDEVSVQVEILRLRRGDLNRLTENSVQVERSAIDGLIARGAANPLLSTSVGLRGSEPEQIEVQRRVDAVRSAGFSAEIAGRVDRSTQAVQLDVALAVGSRGLDENGDGEPDLLESQNVSSAWRVADGGTVLVELAGGHLLNPAATIGGRAESETVVAVALTPTVTHLGTARSMTSFGVGTESHLALTGQPDDSQLASREDLRERLRERLRRLPRGLQDDSNGGRDPDDQKWQ